MRPIRDAIGSEPPMMEIQNRFSGRLSKARNAPGELLKTDLKREGILPRSEKRNIGNGVAVGALEAGVAAILEQVIGFPLGASVDIIDSEVVDENTERYTVNVNAPTKNMAEVRAFIDSTTGFTSLITEKFELEKTTILRTRTVRDTHQVELLVTS